MHRVCDSWFSVNALCCEGRACERVLEFFSLILGRTWFFQECNQLGRIIFGIPLSYFRDWNCKILPFSRQYFYISCISQVNYIFNCTRLPKQNVPGLFSDRLHVLLYYYYMNFIIRTDRRSPTGFLVRWSADIDLVYVLIYTGSSYAWVCDLLPTSSDVSEPSRVVRRHTRTWWVHLAYNQPQCTTPCSRGL